MAKPRVSRRMLWIVVPVVLLAMLIAFWNWNWFIPIVEARASSATGRRVTLSQLHIGLGRTITIEAGGIVVYNPPDWPSSDPPFVRLRAVTLTVNVLDYLRGKGLIIPQISLDRPELYVAETKDGEANFRLNTSSSGASGGASPKIGDVRITDGAAKFLIPKLKANFDTTARTEGEGPEARIVVDAKGTYAAAPITGHFVGGALLSLRDAQNPWPAELTLANGNTHLSAKGTLLDPVGLKGANVTMIINGPDFSQLEPLLGFPIPKTPPYRIAGKLDLQGFSRISLQDFQGQLGNSDIAGAITEEPGGAQADGTSKPVVSLDLASNRVDLNDLAGFIGATPGSASMPNATPEQRAAVTKAAQSKSLLPDTPISIPRLNWADVHMKYRAAHIEGRNVPFDNLAVALDVVNGRILVHPVAFGVGKGRLIGNLDATPEAEKSVHAKLDLRMQNLDVSRLMAATHTFQGAGAISGVGAIDATGNSVASLLGHGNGELKMAMAGGDLSALLIDLTGLQFGNALLSALGVPDRTQVECFVGDLALRRGLVNFRALTLDTKEAITNVGGEVDLGNEAIDLNLKTDAKHFSIGSLPTRIHIGGTFKDPSIRPGAEIAARTGAAVGLGVLFAPLALLPTVQFGTSEAEDARCDQLLRQARAGAGGQALPAPHQNAGGHPSNR